MADLNDLTQNVNIWNDEKSKSVTVTTDGASERLDVDAKITGTGSGTVSGLLKPRYFFDTTDVTLIAADTTIMSVDFEGAAQFLSIATNDSNIEVTLDADGTEILRTTPKLLSELKAQLFNGGVETIALYDNKNAVTFDLRRTRVSSNFTVKANNNGKKIKAIFFQYEVV